MLLLKVIIKEKIWANKLEAHIINPRATLSIYFFLYLNIIDI